MIFMSIVWVNYRVPCTEKTDADLPRYGKKAELDTVPHIRVPAMQEIHAGQAQNTAIVLAPNDVVTEAGIHLAVLAIPEEGEVCVDMQVGGHSNFITKLVLL